MKIYETYFRGEQRGPNGTERYQTGSRGAFEFNILKIYKDDGVRYWLAGISASGIGPSGTVFATG